LGEIELYKLKRRLVEYCELFTAKEIEGLEAEEVKRCYEQSMVRLMIRISFLRRHGPKPKGRAARNS